MSHVQSILWLLLSWMSLLVSFMGSWGFWNMKVQNTKNSIHSTSSMVMWCIFQDICSGKNQEWLHILYSWHSSQSAEVKSLQDVIGYLEQHKKYFFQMLHWKICWSTLTKAWNVEECDMHRWNCHTKGTVASTKVLWVSSTSTTHISRPQSKGQCWGLTSFQTLSIPWL